MRAEQKDKTQEEKFVEIPFTIEAEKAETICIETAQKTYGSGTTSLFAQNLNTSLNAINRYLEKLTELYNLLDNNRLSTNMVLMRELNELLNAFPTQLYPQLSQKMLEQYSDTNIIS